GEVHPVLVGAALAAVVVDVQDVDPLAADEWERASRGNCRDHRSLDVRLAGGEAAGAGLVDVAAAQVAGPEPVEAAVLDEHCDRAIVLVGDGHGAAPGDAAVDRYEVELGAVAEEDHLARHGDQRDARGGGGGGGVPAVDAGR